MSLYYLKITICLVKVTQTFPVSNRLIMSLQWCSCDIMMSWEYSKVSSQSYSCPPSVVLQIKLLTLPPAFSLTIHIVKVVNTAIGKTYLVFKQWFPLAFLFLHQFDYWFAACHFPWALLCADVTVQLQIGTIPLSV